MNALTNFQLTVKDVIPENVRKQVGRAAIETVINRIRNAEDVTDSPATPYSAHGPIYIPVARSFRGGGWKAGKAIKGVGSNSAYGYGVSRRFASTRNSAGATIDGYSRTGHSLRFENYSHFKRYLGRSGSRDLEVTGEMLRAIGITENVHASVSIGFDDLKQEMKMKGNQNRSVQWGISPNDMEKLYALLEGILDARAQSMFEQLLRKSTP